ncbi:unnamed protein product [Prorocentrum cordatum]|uniref:Uncharacterized protein n=1 Tax=Prorocentrum cordatum TaxID=2364126 RepID=A0ABN9RRK7_9DINO|nr:unnamed protein product [Polarella glacialis]
MAPGFSAPVDVEHCSFAKKVPLPAKTGNDEVDRRNKDEYEDLVECIDIMVAFPQTRPGCVRELRKMRREIEAKKSQSQGSLAAFAATGTTLGQFIKKNEANAKEYDKDALYQQFQFVLGASLSFRIPKE